MVFVRNFRCYLTTANISASILIIAISVTVSMAAFYDSFKLLLIAEYAALFYQSLFSCMGLDLDQTLQGHHSLRKAAAKQTHFLHSWLLIDDLFFDVACLIHMSQLCKPHA